MRQLMDEGLFWQRYLRYFRFSEAELEQRRDGILIDHLPKALRPFRQHIFGPSAQRLMRRLGVPATLGEDNRALVAGAPLLIAALLDREEYVPGELSAFYSVFGLGAAIENLWLTTVELGLGIQFVSAPMEIPEQWARIERLLDVPDDLALMAVYRVGHVPARGAPADRLVVATPEATRRLCVPQLLHRTGASRTGRRSSTPCTRTADGHERTAPPHRCPRDRDRPLPARPGRREGDRPVTVRRW
jgi:hypothetical protein